MHSFQRPRSRESPNENFQFFAGLSDYRAAQGSVSSVPLGRRTEKLPNDDAVARQVALEMPDIMVALLPNVLRDELLWDPLLCQQLGMDADDQQELRPTV
jgi:hypothetical protein